MSRLAPLVLLLALAGCRKGGAPDAGAPTPEPEWLAGRWPVSATRGTPLHGGTLTVRLAVEPAGLTRVHDRFAEGTAVRLGLGTVYETLARVSSAQPEAPLEPLLAERWAVGADHRRLTVTLREGVRFHDGQALTAADVKATLEAVLAPSNPTAAFRAALGSLATVTATDERTLEVTWREPEFYAARTLLAGLPVLPGAALAGDFDALALHRAPVGTGPFRLEAWAPGQALTFARFEGYWGPRPHLERLVFRVVKDDTVAVQAWERGEFDVMTRIPAATWRAVEAEPWAHAGYHRLLVLENAYSWIGFNQRLPRFRDPRVRRALALLYPADLVARTVEHGLEPRTTCPWYAASAGCDPAVRPEPFDVDRARRLLDEAGASPGGDAPLRFTFLVPAQSGKMGRVLPLYQEALARAGVELTVEAVDVAGYVARLRRHDFEAAALAWATPDTVQDGFEIFHASQADGGSNFVGYANPEVDRRLEALRREFDPARRVALEREVHRLLADDQAYLFLGLRPRLEAVKRRVHGPGPSLAGFDFARLWVEPAP